MADKITKSDLVEAIYNGTDIEQKDIRIVVDALFEQLKEALKKRSSVELRGFGTFEVRERKGRSKARNPKTGEIVSVAPHGVAAFRPGKELKEAVWILPQS